MKLAKLALKVWQRLIERPYFAKEMAPIAQDEEFALVKHKYITADEISKLKGERQTTSLLLGKRIGITDSFWYLHSLKEIFAEEVYRFRSSSKSPYILDCGANIGLSAIYFKRLYPEARVIAFEPDVSIAGLLTSNLRTFGYTDVLVENKAVWRERTVLEFAATGSLGGRLRDRSADPESDAYIIKIPTVRLGQYLNEKVDFLKMDIEGAEVEVLEDCSDRLTNVQHLFVEYHSDPKKEQHLDCLLSTLKAAGFRIYIKEAWNNLPHPFMRSEYKPCYDLQLNVFAYRN